METILAGLARFAEKLRDVVAEDLGVLPEEIQELNLVEHTEGDPVSAYPVYIVALPDQNLEMFLWDYHNDGNIEVYSKTTLVEGYCYPIETCPTCVKLQMQGETPKLQ